MTVEISKLPNGLHVLTHNMPHLESVALGIWIKAGARDENPEENGVAHFLEHMAFKGTKRRSAQDIAEEIESAGGEINAATGMETTTYYARTFYFFGNILRTASLGTFEGHVFEKMCNAIFLGVFVTGTSFDPDP